MAKKKEAPAPIRSDDELALVHAEPLDNMELFFGTWQCLRRTGVQTIGDLASKTTGELMSIPLFQEEYLDEIREKLMNEYGLTLADEQPEPEEKLTVGAVLQEQHFSEDALFLTDALLKGSKFIERLIDLSDTYGVHMLVLINKLPGYADEAVEQHVLGETAILDYMLRRLTDHIVELAKEGKL